MDHGKVTKPTLFLSMIVDWFYENWIVRRFNSWIVGSSSSTMVQIKDKSITSTRLKRPPINDLVFKTMSKIKIQWKIFVAQVWSYHDSYAKITNIHMNISPNLKSKPLRVIFYKLLGNSTLRLPIQS